MQTTETTYTQLLRVDAHASGLSSNGDNEITGIHVADGDPTVSGILGAKAPAPFEHGWRVIWTQQHGDNNLWEIIPNRHRLDLDD